MRHCDYHEADHGKGGCPRCNADRASEAVPVKAYKALVDGFDPAIFHAPTRDKARHMARTQLRDAYGDSYCYRDIRMVRAPASDGQDQDRKNVYRTCSCDEFDYCAIHGSKP